MKIASKLIVLAVCGAACSAHAGPSGPSAIMAAKLKKQPTSTWLAHYLPDDRYKIAGGVWKFVSTDLDTYYHRPDSPNMLRQPAGMVIGFASAEDAEDAGYLPDGNVGDPASVGTSTMGGAVLGKAKRIKLSDKTSSVLLPAGWRRGPSTITKSNYGVSTTDTLIGPGGETVAAISTSISIPGLNGVNLNLGRFANATFTRQMMNNTAGMTQQLEAMRGSAGSMTPQQQASFNALTDMYKKMSATAEISDISISGVPGVRVANPTPMGGKYHESYTLGSGNKMWIIAHSNGQRVNGGPVVKSFQLR